MRKSSFDSQKLCTKKLEALGYLVGRTESYSSYTGQSNDLFGCIDAVGITPRRIVGLQFCGSDYASHVMKIEPLESAKAWSKVNIIYLIGVRKLLADPNGRLEKYFYRVGYFDNENKYIELQTWKDRIDNLLVIEQHETEGS